MSAPAASALVGLQSSMAGLADCVAALGRRFTASQASPASGVSQLVGLLTAAGREQTVDCGVLLSNSCKALEAVAEEARVRAAQLDADAVLLEREAEDGEERGAVAAACALLCFSTDAAPPCPCVTMVWNAASLWRTVDVAVRVRDGVYPTRCTMIGQGFSFYHAGGADNLLRVGAVDVVGDAVEGIEAADVSVRVSVEGVCITLGSVKLGGAGCVDVAYRIPEGVVEPVTIKMSVFGAVLRSTPWEIVPHLLQGSSILAEGENVMPPERVAAFLRALRVWLPRRTYTLLYRGSRDGMTAAAFHSLCDGKGPTLVLVRCDQGWVFGGYAGASWESPDGDEDNIGTASPDAFLFSVDGPYSSRPVQFPVVPAKANAALGCLAGCGPWFSGGLRVKSTFTSPTAPFDGTSRCLIGGLMYQDVLRRGRSSLTGDAAGFVPIELEVFAVVRS